MTNQTDDLEIPAALRRTPRVKPDVKPASPVTNIPLAEMTGGALRNDTPKPPADAVKLGTAVVQEIEKAKPAVVDAERKSVKPKARKPTKAEAEAKPKAKAKGKRTAKAKTPTTRAESKQARFIEAMRTPKGISIAEAAERFGWQKHTVRGAIAGAVKKKLGLDVEAEQDAKRGTVYRIKK
ncbi:MAG: DUF3489 domain-containing protein [Reyranella sp.]